MSSNQFNIADVKTEKLSNFCQCCLIDTNLKSMSQSHVFDSHVEVYSKMLSRCFSIQIIQNDEITYYICNNCVCKLRQCYSFRRQVEKAQNELNNLIDQNINSHFSDGSIYDDDSMNCVFNNKDSSEFISKAEDMIVQEIMHSKKGTQPKIEIGLQIEMDDSDENIPIKKIRKKLLKASRLSKTSARTKIQRNFESDERLDDQVKSRKRAPSVKPWKSSNLKFDEKTCTCSICNEAFTGQKPLTAHMGLHFPNFVCDLCGKSFVARKNLSAHLKKTHDNEMIRCEICNKLLKKNSLTRHILSHDSIKDKNVYACPSCPERFDSFFKRIKHLAAVHNKTNYKYSCKFCSKEYRMSSGLSRHIRSYHLQEKKYTCEECGLCFFSNGDKRDHMVKHNGDKIHECHICLKSYARKKTLREHLKIHDPFKRYKCTVCEKQFTQKCSLVGHMKIHDKTSDSKAVFF